MTRQSRKHDARNCILFATALSCSSVVHTLMFAALHLNQKRSIGDRSFGTGVLSSGGHGSNPRGRARFRVVQIAPASQYPVQSMPQALPIDVPNHQPSPNPLDPPNPPSTNTLTSNPPIPRARVKVLAHASAPVATELEQGAKSEIPSVGQIRQSTDLSVQSKVTSASIGSDVRQRLGHDSRFTKSSATGGAVSSGKGGSRAALKRGFVRPSYTVEAEEAMFETEVEAEIEISAEGKVLQIRLSQELPYGLQPDLEWALKQARYEPARDEHGQAVSGWVHHRIIYTLAD